MNDVEDLLVRALADDRRAINVPPGAVGAVDRATRRIRRHRQVAVGAVVVVCVAVVAGGTVLADGGSAHDGKVPSYNASVSAQPRTS